MEFNDLGRLTTGDGIAIRPSLTYREATPGRLFRNYRFMVKNQNTEWNLAGEHQQTTGRNPLRDGRRDRE